MIFNSILLNHKDGYRADITGLRGVAVLYVIIYHFSKGRIFSSGFVGVDIFFTISGFLITRILISKDFNTHSYVNFYKRRIKRILPALLFMIFSISIVAYVVLLPQDLKNYSHSLISSVLFLSNLYFIKTMSSGYFGTDTNTIPLIHTWSLAIEEQYYIFFPVFLWLTRTYKRNIVAAILILFSIMSLLLCYMAKNRPLMLYYSPLTHGFPLMLGSIAAILIENMRLRFSRVVREFGALLAISLMLYATIYISSISYPNYSVLIPCAASLILIIIGEYRQRP